MPCQVHYLLQGSSRLKPPCFFGLGWLIPDLSIGCRSATLSFYGKQLVGIVIFCPGFLDRASSIWRSLDQLSQVWLLEKESESLKPFLE